MQFVEVQVRAPEQAGELELASQLRRSRFGFVQTAAAAWW
jgi:hypothetical protein